MDKKKLYGGLLALFVLAAIFTIFFYNYAMNIESRQILAANEFRLDSAALQKPIVYIGVISRYPPNIIYHGYQPILDFLTSRTSYRFELKLSDDYTQAVQMLIKKEVAAAFLGSYVYVRAHKEYGIVPILKPLNENAEPFTRSVLFTSASSRIYNVDELRGKKIALPSPESFSSNWLLKRELPAHRFRVTDLAEVKYFPHHQSVIEYVSRNMFDAGVTREYLIKKLIDKSLRVLQYSEPYPTSPLVVAADSPREIVAAITGALLAVNQENRERIALTERWDAEFRNGFVAASDSDYNSIRNVSR
jgi:phosphonate transport system substrate-binding protein